MYFSRGEIPRFEKLAEKISIEGDYECWVWNGTIAKTGYGLVQVYERWNREKGRSEYKQFSLHRLMYEMFKEPIPAGLVINHLCENKPCCNPLHLEACTTRENNLYSDGVARRNSQKTHCKNGHPYSGDNLLKIPRGRDCRTCQRAREHKYHLKRVR